MSRETFIDLVEKVLDAPKTLAGIGMPQKWQPNRNPAELCIKLPIEIDGTQQGHKIVVVFEPSSHDLKFSILIVICDLCVTRLDFDPSGGHTNSLLAFKDGLPAIVSGKHFHRWSINRTFVRANGHLEELENAEPLPESIRTFDAALRWFCDACAIALPHDHLIELPSRSLI